jgi:hypothetical protein
LKVQEKVEKIKYAARIMEEKAEKLEKLSRLERNPGTYGLRAADE